MGRWDITADEKMKKYLLICAAIMLGVMAFTGCKKDKDKTEDLSNLTEAEKKLVGKWDLQLTVIKQVPEVPMIDEDGTYLNVKADHTYLMASEAEGNIESGTWSLKDNYLTRNREGSSVTFEVLELTAQKLTFKEDTPGGYSVVYYFEK